MKKIYVILFSIFVLLLGVSSCTNHSKKEFNEMLVELAGNDATIDVKDWQKIQKFINDNKQNLPSDFFENDKVNIENIKTYISDFFKNRRPPMTISFFGMTGGDQYLTVKFYLERSGSTFGYDTPQCDGNFKAAIVGLLNSLPVSGNKNCDFIVNNGVYKYPKSYKDFIIDPNIFESTKGIGNPSYTDFQKIFNSLLDDTKNNEISILATDMIYSVKEMTGVNTEKIFNEEEGMANAAFLGHAKDKSFILLQMSAGYYGEYYPYNSTKKGITYNGKRPYYFLIIGNNSDIQRIIKDDQYKNFANFNNLIGFQHEYCMNTSGIFKPYYTLALDNSENDGDARVDRDADEGICALKDIKPDRNSGRFKFVLAVDLNSVIADKDYMTDKSNYQIESEDDATIDEIREIKTSDINQNNREMLSKTSHLFIIRVNKFTHNQTIHIKLLNKIPAWVEQSSNDDDTNVNSNNFSKTTFGLKYLINGIYNAYDNASHGNMYYFDMSVELNK